MDLIPYAARLHRDLRLAAEPAGEQAVELAERLVATLESSTRLVLLDAMVEAAAEITTELAPGAVEVRLRGREVDFAVSAPTSAPAALTPTPASVPTAGSDASEAAQAADDAEDGGTARLSLRLPERLKSRVEQAADAAGLSVNAWLVRSIGSILDAPQPASSTHATPFATTTATTTATTGQRHTGWAR